MSDTFKMQKYYERDRFTYDEKQQICRKSDNRCCHCGEKKFINYGATIDHFVPLDKGGCNQNFNLIMLCEDCNNKKDNKLYDISYLKYLKPEYLEPLKQYVEDYVQVMDTAQRNRILAYDEYNMPVTFAIGTKKKFTQTVNTKLKYATVDDIDKLTEYFIRYLKHVDALDSEEAARNNIIFWLNFGCIYYIEKNNEIQTIFAITLRNCSPKEGYKGITCIPNLYLFPYYNNYVNQAIIEEMILYIPSIILKENNIDYIPINLILLAKDKMAPYLGYKVGNLNQGSIEGFAAIYYVVGDESDYDNDMSPIPPEQMNEKQLKAYKFSTKFSDQVKPLIKYFSKYASLEDITWMADCVLSRELIEEHKELANILFKRSNKENE